MPYKRTQKRRKSTNKRSKTRSNTRTNKKSIYYTHNNGDRPYKVCVKGKTASIYTRSSDRDFNVHIKTYPFKKSFVGQAVKGDDVFDSFDNVREAKEFGKGNSLLFRIGKNKYVFVGHLVLEFTTKDPIQEFHSMIGRNDVPYPVAIGTENVYFMLDDSKHKEPRHKYVYVPKKDFTGFPKTHSWALDSYSKFWGTNQFSEEDGLQTNAKRIPHTKVVHE